MENLRSLITLAFLVMLATATVPVMAYGNNGPHQAIIEKALSEAKSMMESDGYPASLNGQSVYGVDPLGYESQLPMQLWIVSGGYTADVPDTNSLQHGYNPTTGKGFVRFGNAVDWASGKSDYQWSYSNAHAYLSLALESDITPEQPDSRDLYSSAWRSAGETMHLVADMTVPAHARTDIHPFIEPYEQVTTRKEIYAYGGGPISGSINYDQFRKSGNIRDLMTSLAKWTHDNFYSEDTIPALTASPDADGYYHATIEGHDVVTCRKTLHSYTAASGIGRGNTVRTAEYYTVSDSKVIETQQRLLLPNAVHGDALTLYELLPKFQAVIDGVALYPTTGQMTLFAHLNHKPTPQWSTMPKIGNGAWVQVNGGTPQYLYSSKNAYPSLSKIQYPLNVNPGDKIRIIYDFGGYTLTSAAYTVPQIETPTKEPADREIPVTQEVINIDTPIPMGTENPWANYDPCANDHSDPWCK
jgi:hypothetical protein